MTKLVVGAVTIIAIASAGFGAHARPVTEEIGDAFQVIVPAYAFGMAVNEKDWGGVKEFAHAFLAMEASVQVLKLIIDERRPDL